MNGGVLVPTTFEYLHEDLGPQVLPVELAWDPGDPLKVSFRFPRSATTWRIWRDLVFDALTSEAASVGDVRFWRDEGHPDYVVLALKGPMSDGSEGRVEFHVPRAALVDVLVRSSVCGELDEWLAEVAS